MPAPCTACSIYKFTGKYMYVLQKKGKKTFVCAVFAALTAWLSSRYAFNFLVRSVYKSHNRKTEQKDGTRGRWNYIDLCSFAMCNIYMEIKADFAFTAGKNIASDLKQMWKL